MPLTFCRTFARPAGGIVISADGGVVHLHALLISETAAFLRRQVDSRAKTMQRDAM